MIVMNLETGMPQHPHPMFRTWGEQVDWFVSRHFPEVGSYVAHDSTGTAFCGRVGDPAKPSGVVLLVEPLRVINNRKR
jgi:hypothetical protein